MSSEHEKIVLGGGCFWCTEAVFSLVEGVGKVTPGYAGGTVANPGYEEVCKGTTGHAEVVSVEYDPGRVSLEELLGMFFASHDPTSLSRQGNDAGTQYRSIILYSSEEQRARAEKFIESIRNTYGEQIVTEVKRLEGFYPAEEYHQMYYKRNPDQPYCRFVVAPKVEKAKKKLGAARD
ncbi:MAG: peptide-methionine (S)-S-oxide reductase MsrA [Actinobacteria bacterium]|nr:peptide-methionine (S)-S-oxide reductase MsrA [Actinomycetota bacterium]